MWLFARIRLNNRIKIIIIFLQAIIPTIIFLAMLVLIRIINCRYNYSQNNGTVCYDYNIILVINFKEVLLLLNLKKAILLIPSWLGCSHFLYHVNSKINLCWTVCWQIRWWNWNQKKKKIDTLALGLPKVGWTGNWCFNQIWL